MTLSDFTLNDFDSLEEAANEIAHKMNITGGDQLCTAVSDLHTLA